MTYKKRNGFSHKISHKNWVASINLKTEKIRKIIKSTVATIQYISIIKIILTTNFTI